LNQEKVSFLKENTEFTSLELLYRFTRDGNSHKELFPKIVDKGEIIAIIKSNFGKVFGGYSSVPYKAEDLHLKDPKAFIFSITNLKKYSQISINENALYHYPEGIFWGKSADDLYLHMKPGN
jgi:hypothetical protein